MACFFFKRRKSKANNEQPAAASTPVPTIAESSSASASVPARSRQQMYEERGAHQRLREFNLEELRTATNGFSPALKLGEGGFGTVFRASFHSAGGGQVTLAVKSLNVVSSQGHKQWVTEVKFLSILEHRNLVKLVGYCSVDNHRLLVYEYMPNRDLDCHLFSSDRPPLSWKRRLNIMIGAGRGLKYLHEGIPEDQVIFRDFKPANILLDADFEPKLSDFGLAREGPIDGRSHVSTGKWGTDGYAAPDYVETGHLSSKSDVWSFGVVLYEILTGRRVLDETRPTEERILLVWVLRHPPESPSFRSIMDPRLDGRYPEVAARQVVRLADRCLRNNAKERAAHEGGRGRARAGGPDRARRRPTVMLRSSFVA